MLRGWDNAFAVAALILTVGGFILSNGGWKPSEFVFWAVLGGSVIVMCLAIVLLRPTQDQPSTRLHNLRSRLRDIAVLSVAMRITHEPKFASDEALNLTPPGLTWSPETEAEADERARRLIAIGLMQ